MNIVNVGSVANSVTNANSPPVPAQANMPAGTGAEAAPVQTVNAVQQAAMAPSNDQVKQAVQTINKSWSNARGLEFSVDDDITIVKVVDMKTKDIIRQMPSEETIAIAKSLEQAIGSLVNEKA